MIPRVLTIAGSDSGGGAGIQADIKTFTALKVFGMSVVTSITAQNTQGVMDILDLPGELVAKQIEVVVGDIGVDAAKTGMLSNAPIIEAAAEGIRRYKIKMLIVDPVLRAKGGQPLLRPDAQQALVREILPLAFMATPNIPEAEALAGLIIKDARAMEEAAKRIIDMGPGHVIVKGGHLLGERCGDLLYDGRRSHLLDATRIQTKNTHGTGCTLSAAIAAHLALGLDVLEAAQRAKAYVTGAIAHSFAIGKGHGPLNHFWSSYDPA